MINVRFNGGFVTSIFFMLAIMLVDNTYRISIMTEQNPKLEFII